MAKPVRKSIRFRGRNEDVLETFRVHGRTYFALERLSSNGAFRVFDPHAGPHGDYRVLHRIPGARMTPAQLEVVRRIGGPNGNRNFPGVVDFARQRNDLFIVIAWVYGTNLRTFLTAVRGRQVPRASVSEVVRLVRGLVHGLSHYHRRTNIIHGDISPANIIISSGTKNLVLIDFGSAWPIERTAQRDHDAFSQPYAAPERMAKHAAEDFRSDIFSLSSIAYEMLTISLPYEGLGGHAGLPKLARDVGQSYRDPSQLIRARDRLPKRTLVLLDDCIRRGLELHPDDRFPTSSEWISAWDALYLTMQKGGRLSRIEQLVVSGIDALVSRFSRSN